jgi:hypothetical protein
MAQHLLLWLGNELACQLEVMLLQQQYINSLIRMRKSFAYQMTVASWWELLKAWSIVMVCACR